MHTREGAFYLSERARILERERPATNLYRVPAGPPATLLHELAANRGRLWSHSLGKRLYERNARALHRSM